jgi:hypothetical protein
VADHFSKFAAVPIASRVSEVEVTAARAVLGFLKSDPKKPEKLQKTGPFSRKILYKHHHQTTTQHSAYDWLCCCRQQGLLIVAYSQRGVFFSFPMWCISGLPKSGTQWHKKHESSYLAFEMARRRCRC